MRAGLVAVPVNTKLPQETIGYIVDDAAIAFCFTDADKRPMVPAGMPLICFDDSGPRAFAARCPPVAFETLTVGPDEIGQILYTSGSSGRPKGVPLTHAGQLWALSLRDGPPSDRHLVAQPLFHMNGLMSSKVAFATNASLVLMPGFEPRTLAEFIALARQAPGKFNMGSSGNGGMSHLALELLKRRAGVDIVHVPYRGSAPALQDLLAGNIQLMIDPYGPFVGRAETGLVRVLAVTSLERIPALPDVPTMSETPGLEGFEATGFVGVVAPAATPGPVIARLEEAVAWAMREPDLERTYVAQGQTPRFANAAAFRDRIARGQETWGRVAREANITVD